MHTLKSPTPHSSSPGPRRRVLPPEIIQMILQYLADDKATLRACSRTAPNFCYAALSLLGRHLRVDTIYRLRGCTPLITKGAFQHVRSLELGINNKRVTPEECLDAYLVILGVFAQYRALNRLWLSEIPFHFVGHNQKKILRNTIVHLSSTVTEIGLYGCHFSSYEEMISLIRSFPLHQQHGSQLISTYLLFSTYPLLTYIVTSVEDTSKCHFERVIYIEGDTEGVNVHSLGFKLHISDTCN